MQETDTTLSKVGALIKERNNFIENELKCRKSNNFHNVLNINGGESCQLVQKDQTL